MSPIYVLLAIDTTPDQAPNEVWTFSSAAAAESFLRGWSRDFLGGHSHAVDNLPPDAELVAAFRAAGTSIHLYQCDLRGNSEELVPFEHAPEPQLTFTQGANR
jgi:hypothetical protein